MAEYISFQPSDNFSTTLYTGDGTSANAITGVGFQPDFVWNKPRDTTGWQRAFDSVRGVLNVIYPNDTYVNEVMPSPGGLNSFDSDGYTMGTNTGSNENTKLFVTWNWKMGTTSGLTGGTITPTGYSFSTTSGQSIIAYTGNLTSGATVPHGLGAVPKMIIVKSKSLTANWMVYHSGIATDAETDYLNLNNANAAGDNNTIWNDTAPTSSVFSLGNNTDVNGSAATYIAYCFADVKGYSNFGSYIGNGNADGPFVYTGFRPAFVMIKCASRAGTDDWRLFDDKREGYNVDNDSLSPNTEAVERTADEIDLCSNGFKLRHTATDTNPSGETAVYAAFAEFPIVSSNDIPGVAR